MQHGIMFILSLLQVNLCYEASREISNNTFLSRVLFAMWLLTVGPLFQLYEYFIFILYEGVL
jgi:hypothetical protein